MNLTGWLPIWLLVMDWALRLALAVHVIMRRRSVSTSLAWLAILLFTPFLGLFVYALVGESRLGRKRLARYEALTKSMEEQAVRLWQHRHLETDLADRDAALIARFGTAVSGLPPLRGNRLTLLPDNDSMLASLLADIDEAREHVHLLYYIWCVDSAGARVEDALKRAAARGVQCRVLVDGVGARPFLRSGRAAALRQGGVQVVEALPVNVLRLLFARVDLRNHRKIAVIDGRVAYCGSQNINDTTFRSKRWRKTGPWVDSTVRVDGPAAQALAVTFLRDWMADSDEDLRSVERFLPNIQPHAESESVVHAIPSGPGPAPESIHQALLTTIYTARDELIMTTPYFVPDEATLLALRAAATRGVRITMVMPCVSDAPLVAAASRSHYIDLLEAGVRILHYRGGLLHAKTVTVDRKIGLIGSTNFDNRSFFLNFEITLFIYDDDFASVMRFMQMAYVDASEEIHLHEWRQRRTWEVFRDNSAQLLGPLL